MSEQITRYRNRISGLLIDRIDIRVELAAPPVTHPIGEARQEAESSASVARYRNARLEQSARTYHRVLKLARTCADLRALQIFGRSMSQHYARSTGLLVERSYFESKSIC